MRKGNNVVTAVARARGLSLLMALFSLVSLFEASAQQLPWTEGVTVQLITASGSSIANQVLGVNAQNQVVPLADPAQNISNQAALWYVLTCKDEVNGTSYIGFQNVQTKNNIQMNPGDGSVFAANANFHSLINGGQPWERFVLMGNAGAYGFKNVASGNFLSMRPLPNAGGQNGLLRGVDEGNTPITWQQGWENFVVNVVNATPATITLPQAQASAAPTTLGKVNYAWYGVEGATFIPGVNNIVVTDKLQKNIAQNNGKLVLSSATGSKNQYFGNDPVPGTRKVLAINATLTNGQTQDLRFDEYSDINYDFSPAQTTADIIFRGQGQAAVPATTVPAAALTAPAVVAQAVATTVPAVALTAPAVVAQAVAPTVPSTAIAGNLQWTMIDGLLVQGSLNKNSVFWGVNSNKGIFQRTLGMNGTPWTNLSGAATYISVNDLGQVVCIGVDKGIYVRVGVTASVPEGTSWVRIPGPQQFTSVMINNKQVIIALDSAGYIYQTTMSALALHVPALAQAAASSVEAPKVTAQGASVVSTVATPVQAVAPVQAVVTSQSKAAKKATKQGKTTKQGKVAKKAPKKAAAASQPVAGTPASKKPSQKAAKGKAAKKTARQALASAAVTP